MQTFDASELVLLIYLSRCFSVKISTIVFRMLSSPASSLRWPFNSLAGLGEKTWERGHTQCQPHRKVTQRNYFNVELNTEITYSGFCIQNQF